MDSSRQEDGVLALIAARFIVLITLSCGHLEATEDGAIIDLFLALLILLLLLVFVVIVLLVLKYLGHVDVVFFYVVGDCQNIAGLTSHRVAELLAFIDVGQVLVLELLVDKEQVVFKVA
jgi:hypothetical protein